VVVLHRQRFHGLLRRGSRQNGVYCSYRPKTLVHNATIKENARFQEYSPQPGYLLCIDSLSRPHESLCTGS